MLKKIIALFCILPIIGCSDTVESDTDTVNNTNECKSGISFLGDSLLYAPDNQAAFLDEVGREYFMYYWNECQPNSKMARIGTERARATIALAGSAYAVTSLPVAVERGWISYEQGAERFVQVCRFLNRAERYHGAWSHWSNGITGAGLPFNANQQSAGDLVETSFMMMGLFVCSEYFNRGGANETEAIQLVESFWNSIEWNFYTNNQNVLYWAWDKDLGFAPLKVTGPNEAFPAYILALAAPSQNAISQSVFDEGWRGGRNYYNPGRTTYGYRYELGKEAEGGPLFTTQHPFLWLNPYRLSDNYADYWEVCTNHTLINRHYCLYEAPQSYGYNEYNWGLSACYGPESKGYKGRSPARDDGVIATTASIGAVSVTPYYAMQAFNTMKNSPSLIGTYGVSDAYSFVDSWSDPRYLSISIMPIVSIIENYRTGLIWRLAMQNEKISRGIALAGLRQTVYDNGFCQMPVDIVDNTVDLVVNPDTGKYGLRYSLNTANTATFNFFDCNGVLVYTVNENNTMAGINQLEFDYNTLPKEAYVVNLSIDDTIIDTINIRLR